MNFVEFPDITPSSMDFTPPRFPVGSDTSLGGVTSRRKFGNRPSEGRLQVEFRNISNFTCSQILLACIQSRGLAPIAFKESFFLGAGPDLKPYLDCSAYPGLLWFFIEESPPRINRVEGGSEVSNMSLELAAKLLPQGAQGTVGPIVFPALPSITPPRITIKDFLYDIEVDPSQPLEIGDSSRPGSDGTIDKWRSLSLLMNEPDGLARIGSNGLIPYSLLPVFSSNTPGVVPGSGGGTSNYLRSDGQWAEPPGGGGGGDGSITVSAGVPVVTHTVAPTSLTEINPTANINFNGSQDEDNTEVQIGFPIQIFGTTYTSVFINSNSLFTFGGSNEDYGSSSYEEWIQEFPFPGVFIGAYDSSYQIISSTGATGATGQRTNTIRFQGSADYSNSNPALSDIFWEITFKENEPGKIYLNIIAFNDRGGTEGSDFFTFTSNGQTNGYIPFSPATGSQYIITMSSGLQLTDYTGGKIVLLDDGIEIEENQGQDSIEIELGLNNCVRSDTSAGAGFNKIRNMVSLSQSAFNSLATKDPETLYVVVN